jgi:redox-sensitive bicupin YhaK (pirin superfamily)
LEVRPVGLTATAILVFQDMAAKYPLMWGLIAPVVAPGGGFYPHLQRDMEIISYVLEGALEHKDSLSTGSVILPGDVSALPSTTVPVRPGYQPPTAPDALVYRRFA